MMVIYVSTTKPIENVFGNLDRELSKAGPTGFQKAADDLTIKYSKDLITPRTYQWHMKSNRKIAQDLRVIEKDFTVSQKALLSQNLHERDANLLTDQNKILKCISLCKNAHNGPVTSKREMKILVKKLSGDEKALHSSLNIELRLRKLTYSKIKQSCSLFKQKDLSCEEKAKNLEMLIESQLSMKAMAEMSDLEVAIRAQPHPTISEKSSSDISQGNTTYCEGEFVVGLFEDGFYPGEILKVEGDFVTIDFLAPIFLKQNVTEKSLWKKTSETAADIHSLETSSILPIRPVLHISKFSNRRIIIYELVNVDSIEKFLWFNLNFK